MSANIEVGMLESPWRLGRAHEDDVRRKNAPPSLESAGREHEGGTPGCASPLGRTPSSHIVERWKSYGSDMQGVDRPHHISTEALECRVRPAAGSHTKRLGEAKTVRECWGYLRRAHERWGSQARDSGVSQHWGAGAQSRGRGLSRANDFFRGVSSHAPSVKRIAE